MNKPNLNKTESTDNNIDPKLSDYLLKYGEQEKYTKNLNRLINKEPIQYILNNVNFYGYDFYVDKNVLIPRFETEELIYYTKQYINKNFRDNINILDIGTGSGCIAITIKKEIPKSEVYAVDISNKALKVAKKNAELNGVKIHFYKGDMLKPILNQKIQYDIIISNPPYIKEDEIVEEIVLHNEPSIALYGGKDGLKYYQEILSTCSRVLKTKYLIAFEIGCTQAKDVIMLAKSYLPNSTTEVKQDMSKKDRFIFIRNN